MSLENLSVWHVMAIVLVGLFVFGPDRLPKAITDGLRVLRHLRRMAQDATGELSRELGTEVSLEDLHPKTLLRKHLLSEDDEAMLRAPIDELLHDLRDTARVVERSADGGVPAPAKPHGVIGSPVPYADVT